MNKLFCVTDGRAWYKQVITGTIKTVLYGIASFMAFVFISALYYAILDSGMVNFLLGLGAVILIVAAVLFIFILILLIFMWAEDEFNY